MTDLKPSQFSVDGRDVRLEHPVEIAVSKMRHRPRTLKVRDIYDIAAVDQVHSKLLEDNLHHLTAYKSELEARLDDVTADYLAAELAEIDVLSGWEDLPTMAFDRVREIVDAIPEPAYKID